MLFTIRRRSQVALFLALVGRTYNLDRRVKEQKNVHLLVPNLDGMLVCTEKQQRKI